MVEVDVADARHPAIHTSTVRVSSAQHVIVLGDKRLSEKPGKNQPLTPSTSTPPSTVLNSPRPLSTSYLLYLSSLQSGRKAHTHALQSTPEMELERRPASMSDEEHIRRVMPCHYLTSRRDRNDMLMVGLVALFLIAVLVMETWVVIVNRYAQCLVLEPLHFTN
jgi:hypothetical protein